MYIPLTLNYVFNILYFGSASSLSQKKHTTFWKRFHKLEQFQYKVNTNLLKNVENIGSSSGLVYILFAKELNCWRLSNELAWIKICTA